MAVVVLVAPLLALLIGAPLMDQCPRTISSMMMLMLPFSALAVILLIMATVGRKSRDKFDHQVGR
jgi:ABC-type microcin C transport system permease subunit YejE